MLTLEQACTGLGVALGDVLAHKVYPDRVVVVVKDGRKLVYRPEAETTKVVTTPAPGPKARKGRAISTDIKDEGG